MHVCVCGYIYIYIYIYVEFRVQCIGFKVYKVVDLGV